MTVMFEKLEIVEGPCKDCVITNNCMNDNGHVSITIPTWISYTILSKVCFHVREYIDQTQIGVLSKWPLEMGQIINHNFSNHVVGYAIYPKHVGVLRLFKLRSFAWVYLPFYSCFRWHNNLMCVKSKDHSEPYLRLLGESDLHPNHRW